MAPSDSVDPTPRGASRPSLKRSDHSIRLQGRYRKQGTLRGLEYTITLEIAACLDVHPDHKPIQNLALRFSFQYEKLVSAANLEQAVTLRRAALNLWPQVTPMP